MMWSRPATQPWADAVLAGVLLPPCREQRREVLLSVGFADVKLAGRLDGEAPYDEAARRLVAIARRTF